MIFNNLYNERKNKIKEVKLQNYERAVNIRNEEWELIYDWAGINKKEIKSKISTNLEKGDMGFAFVIHLIQ